MFEGVSEDISNASSWQTQALEVLSHHWGTSKHLTSLEESIVLFNKVLYILSIHPKISTTWYLPTKKKNTKTFA